MGFTASVAADHSSHRLADTVKGGELSYMTLALQREQTAYRLLWMLSRAVLADTKSMLARLVRGCIAMGFTASVAADHSCRAKPETPSRLPSRSQTPSCAALVQ